MDAIVIAAPGPPAEVARSPGQRPDQAPPGAFGDALAQALQGPASPRRGQGAGREAIAPGSGNRTACETKGKAPAKSTRPEGPGNGHEKATADDTSEAAGSALPGDVTATAGALAQAAAVLAAMAGPADTPGPAMADATTSLAVEGQAAPSGATGTVPQIEVMAQAPVANPASPMAPQTGPAAGGPSEAALPASRLELPTASTAYAAAAAEAQHASGSLPAQAAPAASHGPGAAEAPANQAGAANPPATGGTGEILPGQPAGGHAVQPAAQPTAAAASVVQPGQRAERAEQVPANRPTIRPASEQGQSDETVSALPGAKPAPARSQDRPQEGQAIAGGATPGMSAWAVKTTGTSAGSPASERTEPAVPIARDAGARTSAQAPLQDAVPNQEPAPQASPAPAGMAGQASQAPGAQGNAEAHVATVVPEAEGNRNDTAQAYSLKGFAAMMARGNSQVGGAGSSGRTHGGATAAAVPTGARVETASPQPGSASQAQDGLPEELPQAVASDSTPAARPVQARTSVPGGEIRQPAEADQPIAGEDGAAARTTATQPSAAPGTPKIAEPASGAASAPRESGRPAGPGQDRADAALGSVGAIPVTAAAQLPQAADSSAATSIAGGAKRAPESGASTPVDSAAALPAGQGAGLPAGSATGNPIAATGPSDKAAAAAGTAPAFALPVEGMPPGVGQAILNRLVQAVRRGERECRLELYPAELGRVQARISFAGQKLALFLGVENGQAQAVVQQALPELRMGLEARGITVGQCQVGVAGDGQASSQWQQHQSSRTFAPLPDSLHPRTVAAGGVPVRATPQAGNAGRLDLMI